MCRHGFSHNFAVRYQKIAGVSSLEQLYIEGMTLDMHNSAHRSSGTSGFYACRARAGLHGHAFSASRSQSSM